ncbi:hypothetical protein F7725_004953, partial [Dissostichus mawsoni]
MFLWELYRGLRHGLWEHRQWNVKCRRFSCYTVVLGTLKSAHASRPRFFQNVGTKTSTYPEFPLASTTPIKGPGLGPARDLDWSWRRNKERLRLNLKTLDSSYHPDDTVEESDV